MREQGEGTMSEIVFQQDWKNRIWLWWTKPGSLRSYSRGLSPHRIFVDKSLRFAWGAVLAMSLVVTVLYLRLNHTETFLHSPSWFGLLAAVAEAAIMTIPFFILRSSHRATPTPMGSALLPVMWMCVPLDMLWVYTLIVAVIHFAYRYNPIQVIWNTMGFSFWWLIGASALQVTTPAGTQPGTEAMIVTTIIVILASLGWDLGTAYLAHTTSASPIKWREEIYVYGTSNAVVGVFLMVGWLIVAVIDVGYMGYIALAGLFCLFYLTKKYDIDSLQSQQYELIMGLGDVLARPELLESVLPSLLDRIGNTLNLGLLTCSWVDSQNLCHTATYRKRHGVEVWRSPLKNENNGHRWLRDAMERSTSEGRMAATRRIFDGAMLIGYLAAGYRHDEMGVLHPYEKETIDAFGEQLHQVLLADRRMARKAYLASHDAITNLLNMKAFQEQLSSALESDEGYICVGMLDIDDFKLVNDTHGHDAGDKVIREVGIRLAESLPSGASVARLHGDEFAWFHSWNANRASANLKRSYAATHRQLIAPVVYEGRTIPVSCTIGLAILPCDQTTVESAMRFMDQAMYQGKKSGKAKATWLNPQREVRHVISPKMQPDAGV